MESWTAKAACVGKHEMFEITERSSSFRQDIRDPATRDVVIKSHNASKFKAAVRLCSTCPVISECGQNATHEDRAWTVRAGNKPTSFRARGAGRPARAVYTTYEGSICPRGHVGGMYRDPSGKSRCRECGRENRANQRKKEKSEKVVVPLSEKVCRRGHKGYYRTSNDGHILCGMCKAENNRKYRGTM